ncbi:hypothetical protein QFC22_006208 [Naganishia vaughanmartiniae]|uniref:Uncharacterized protein n=1 Tax=Naganishia vaughanmartiniae TaxID=1424756 RepID=A0ACC2WPF4_9TREE|nr:hypothetical protein QFC22_006208 [Naganishia vaughanmartiniae]
MNTDVYDYATESHGITKKQRTGTADETRIAHSAKALNVEMHSQWQAPNRGAQPSQRSYDLAETDLDELVCGKSPVGINGPEAGKQAFTLPSSPISRYMLAREPASHRNYPPPTTSSSSAAWRNVEDGDTPSQTVSSALEVTCDSANPLQYENPKSDSRPSNSPEISFAVEHVIGAAKTLPVLPIMASTNIYNKRHLCSALNELQFQLYGHDQLEADFILNLKTACIVVPLAYTVANAEKLLDKLAVLALTFESLIVIFDLYPSRTNSLGQAALPDPWTPSTQQTTGDVVRARAAEAKKRKNEKSVESGQSQLEDDSPTISPERQLHHTIRGDGCRQISDGSPIALASNGNSSYCTDFEADIAVDQDLQVGGDHVTDRCPAYYQELGPAFDTAEASSDEADELNLSTFEWS